MFPNFLKDKLIEMVQQASGGQLMSNLSEVLKKYAFADIELDISNFVIPIASVLVCIYFIIILMDKISTDNFNSDQMILLLIKLVFSMLIINNAQEITTLISGFGKAFLEGTTKAATDATVLALDDISGFTLFYMFIIMLIPYFVSWLILLVGFAFVFAYAIELKLRIALAPIGLADLISGGQNSNGYRYLKKLIALAMQGGIMIMIIAAGSQIQQLVAEEAFGAISSVLTLSLLPIAKVLAVQFSVVGLLASAKSIANDIVG